MKKYLFAIWLFCATGAGGQMQINGPFRIVGTIYPLWESVYYFDTYFIWQPKHYDIRMYDCGAFWLVPISDEEERQGEEKMNLMLRRYDLLMQYQDYLDLNELQTWEAI